MEINQFEDSLHEALPCQIVNGSKSLEAMRAQYLLFCRDSHPFERILAGIQATGRGG